MSNPQLARERAVYNYLESLENGDIDGIIQSLQQAVYDAPLDQMLVDAHQAYFQAEQREEQAQRGIPTSIPARTDLPVSLSLSPRARSGRRQKRRVFPLWARVLAVVLLVGVLVGSSIALLMARQGANNAGPAPVNPPSPACTTFKFYPTPDHGTMSDVLSAATVVAPQQAWAVGYAVDSHYSIAPLRTLTEYWNGQKWQIVASPNGQSGNGLPANGQLNAVAAVSAHDVWAVGSYIGGSVHLQNVDNRILIEHWNGTDWQIVPSPSSPASRIPDSPSGNGQLRALAVVSANDIWAAGQTMTLSNKHVLQASPLLEHWDGKAWSIVSGFPVTGQTVLNGLTAVSARDIWVAGARSDNPEAQPSFIAHWDGSQWKLAENFPGVLIFNRLSASRPDDVWAVGMLSASGLPRVEHWDGKKWSPVPLPQLAPSNAAVELFLSGIAAVSASDAWAVGTLRIDGKDTQFLVLHWNGKTWQRVQIQFPQSQADMGYDSANAIVIGYHQTWIVGNTGGRKALIQGCA